MSRNLLRPHRLLNCEKRKRQQPLTRFFAKAEMPVASNAFPAETRAPIPREIPSDVDHQLGYIDCLTKESSCRTLAKKVARAAQN